MEEESRKMCQACGSKEATHHICQPGAEPRNISLCGECMKTDAPSSIKVFMEYLKDGRCRFCGGQAAAIDSLARLIDSFGAEEKFLCVSCSTEYWRAGSRYFEGLSDLADAGAHQRLIQCIENLDIHMKQWVRQRDN